MTRPLARLALLLACFGLESSALAGDSAPPPTAYPWGPTAGDRLDLRFAPPPGFARDAAASGSFAAFLRGLPLLPPGAPVVDYRGRPLYDGGHHPSIAAVVDIDIGKGDLQQCADSVIRLDAEWRYAVGRRDLTYKAASGTAIPYARYLAGERAVLKGKGIELVRRSNGTADTHALLRTYLDDVFAWANTSSLERDAARVAPEDLRAGDFFVMSGSPFGHAVLVLDVARDASGRRALLLGQGYMPAQSFHVLRQSELSAWFIVDKDASELKTPFWAPFSMKALRRL